MKLIGNQMYSEDKFATLTVSELIERLKSFDGDLPVVGPFKLDSIRINEFSHDEPVVELNPHTD